MKRTHTIAALSLVGVVLAGCSAPEHKQPIPGPRVVGASARPSPRKAADVLPFLATFESTMTLADIDAVLGERPIDVGSAIHDLFYTLDDNSSVRVRATYQGKVLSIERREPRIGGHAESIYDTKKEE